ncbi:DUF6491 family protein [Oleiagrimonas soli]|uniref:Lipoprotein n=1 Tax=Oleiagrimonas soli TaxID=1543381 RepID=A0A099CVD6_9GAMM|nr:DUF6491 family protein [Oleiagrimonas soli]KGI76980.1 hypothetical protein LF63_0113610 [Oleiagrimonas soli]MBB6185184.1 hypothetical protein [Oleiagrimonas soli]
MKARLLISAAILVSLAACANVPRVKNDPARVARFEAAAGAPVSTFQFNSLNGFYAWDPISDHQVVTYVTPKRAYLLELPPCPDLQYAPAISITSRMEQVSTNFDSVIPLGNLGGVPCQIRSIRPLNLDMLKDAEEHRGDVEVRARPAAPSATGGKSA